MNDGIDARRTIALVTYADQPALTADDAWSSAALEARGARVTPVVWSDGDAAWTTYDAEVVRSCWDYFLHAVLKRPRSGDFRVQIEHGGTFESVTPSANVIAQAASALSAAPSADPPLYARVDGCIVGGELLLMELELIEPVLFLGTCAGAAERLADAVLARAR